LSLGATAYSVTRGTSPVSLASVSVGEHVFYALSYFPAWGAISASGFESRSLLSTEHAAEDRAGQEDFTPKNMPKRAGRPWRKTPAFR
jgi:hypothetical protein